MRANGGMFNSVVQLLSERIVGTTHVKLDGQLTF